MPRRRRRHRESLRPGLKPACIADILPARQPGVQLINDVLDLSRVDADKLELNPESVDLKNLIAEACNILQSLAASKRLVDEAVERVVIDSARLLQGLYNYLSNAIKFT